MVETGTCSWRSAPLDERVLSVQRTEQACRPAADGCEGVGLSGVAEELGKYRLYCDTVGVIGIQLPLNAPALQQPQPLAGVVDQVVGQRGEFRIGEQPGHLGHCQGVLVSEDGVEQNQAGYPF